MQILYALSPGQESQISPCRVKDHFRSCCSAVNNVLQGSPLLLILHQPSPSSHDPIDNLNHLPEPARSALDLHKTSNAQAYLPPMHQNDEQLDPEDYGLDAQSVLFVYPCRNRVRLSRVLKVPNAVTLPFLEQEDELLPGTTTRNAEAENFHSRFQMEEASEPGSFATIRSDWWAIVAGGRGRVHGEEGVQGAIKVISLGCVVESRVCESGVA